MSENKSRNETPQWVEDNPTTTTPAGEYPVPCTWILGPVDSDGAFWRRYLQATKNDERMEDLTQVEAPDTVASLSINPYEAGSGFDGELRPEYSFEVDGQEVFTVRDADYDDLMETIVEALRAIDLGDDFEEIFDLQPDSGAVVVSEEKRRQAEIEKRREQNAGLTEFTTE